MLHELSIASNLVKEASISPGQGRVIKAKKAGREPAILSKLAALRLIAKYGGSYVNDAAFTPPPVRQPKVPTPGPSTPSIKVDQSLGAASKGFKGTTGTGPATSTGAAKTSSDSTATLLAAGGGGLGGWALGEKLVKPLLNIQEKKLISALQNLQKAKKYAPMGAAAAGAIILAALATATRGTKRPEAQGVLPQYQNYDPTNSGFLRQEQQQVGQYY